MYRLCLTHVYSTINVLNEADITSTAVYIKFILHYQHYDKYIFYLILKTNSMKKRYYFYNRYAYEKNTGSQSLRNWPEVTVLVHGRDILKPRPLWPHSPNQERNETDWEESKWWGFWGGYQETVCYRSPGQKQLLSQPTCSPVAKWRKLKQ